MLCRVNNSILCFLCASCHSWGYNKWTQMQKERWNNAGVLTLILLDSSHRAWHADRHKCCHSSAPLSLIMGGWGNQRTHTHLQECMCVCVRWLIPLPCGKCWLLMSLFYSFHETQSHRLNWASGSHTPVSLTSLLSLTIDLSLSLSLFSCLWTWKISLRKKRERERIARRLPMDSGT